MNAITRHFDTEYTRLGAELPGAGHPALDRARDEALARFVADGLPGTRREDWKYTSLAALERQPLPVAATAAGPAPALALLLARSALPQAVHRLVFVDGHFAPALSQHTLPAGARAGSLASRIADDPAAAMARPVGTALRALNFALGADGLDLELAPGVVVDAPILALFVSSTPERTTLPAVRIALGAGARACVVEQHLGLHAEPALTNVVSRIDLAAGARLQHVKVQTEGARSVHLADCEAHLATEARLASLVLALGGQLAREDLHVTLAAPGAHVDLDGLYLARARMHLDHHTTVLHASPDCGSRQVYRGILDDAGRGVFNGRVVVAKDAQRTDAQQSNFNLLLSDAAEIDTKPQLEIFADDVKCSHGATVGQLDPAELFYLRARGIDAATARTLVTLAFAARSLAGIDSLSPLHAGLRSLLLAHLPAGAELEQLTP